MPGSDQKARVGLCLGCRHARLVSARMNNHYYRCDRAAVDPSYPKYPRLPMLQCDGHERRPLAAPRVR